MNKEKKKDKKSKNLADFLDSVLASKRWHYKNLPLFTFPLKMHTVDRPLTSLTAVKTEPIPALLGKLGIEQAEKHLAFLNGLEANGYLYTVSQQHRCFSLTQVGHICINFRNDKPNTEKKRLITKDCCFSTFQCRVRLVRSSLIRSDSRVD